MAPKDIHVLVPGTCDYVSLCPKWGFADVSKLRALRWADYPGLSGWAHGNRRAFYERKREQEG